MLINCMITSANQQSAQAAKLTNAYDWREQQWRIKTAKLFMHRLLIHARVFGRRHESIFHWSHRQLFFPFKTFAESRHRHTWAESCVMNEMLIILLAVIVYAPPDWCLNSGFNTCFSTRFLFTPSRAYAEGEKKKPNRWMKISRVDKIECKIVQFFFFFFCWAISIEVTLTTSSINDEACIQIAHFAISRQQNELWRKREEERKNIKLMGRLVFFSLRLCSMIVFSVASKWKVKVKLSAFGRKSKLPKQTHRKLFLLLRLGRARSWQF